MPTLREITTDEEWERGEAILRQLWSHVSKAFVSSWREEDDYRLLGWYVDGPTTAPGVRARNRPSPEPRTENRSSPSLASTSRP